MRINKTVSKMTQRLETFLSFKTDEVDGTGIIIGYMDGWIYN